MDDPNEPSDAPDVFANEEPLARSTDDSTSHEAAEDLTATGTRDAQKHQLLQWMIQQGSGGPLRNAREIARDSRLAHPLVHKRLPDLMRDGYICKGPRQPCSITGKRCATWLLVKTSPDPVPLDQQKPRPRKKQAGTKEIPKQPDQGALFELHVRGEATT